VFTARDNVESAEFDLQGSVLAFVCAIWVGGAEYRHLGEVGAGYHHWDCGGGGCSVWVSGFVLEA